MVSQTKNAPNLMPYRSATSCLKPDSLPLKKWHLKKKGILFQPSIYRTKLASFWEGHSIVQTSIKDRLTFLMPPLRNMFSFVHKPLIRLNLDPSWFFIFGGGILGIQIWLYFRMGSVQPPIGRPIYLANELLRSLNVNVFQVFIRNLLLVQIPPRLER